MYVKKKNKKKSFVYYILGFAFTNTSGQLEEEYKQVLRQRDSFGTMGDAYDLLTTEQNDATFKGLCLSCMYVYFSYLYVNNIIM